MLTRAGYGAPMTARPSAPARPFALSRSATIALLAVTFLVPRVGLVALVPQAPESDALAYLAMAEALARGETMRDTFGQVAFYSAGYPMLLGAAFALLGKGLAVAQAVNLLLGLATMALVARIVRQVGGAPIAQALAAAAYAVWIPAAFATGLVAKENLTTPLLLAAVSAAIAVAHGPHPLRAATGGGAAFGFGLVAGGSSALVGLLFPAALLLRWRTSGFAVAARAGAFAAAALALSLGPWLAHTRAELGAPVINTNSGFNLYLGNNPAATGTFVSIADTPAGPGWEALRAQRGELGAADDLQSQALDWIAAHPAAALRLAATKLALFWTPNAPDAADMARDPLAAALRWLDVAQFVIVVVLAGAAAVALRRRHPPLAWLVAAVALFWLLHAAAYVMPRYREPAMPLVIALAALWAGPLVEWWRARRGVS